MINIISLILIASALLSTQAAEIIDPGKADKIAIDSVQVSPGSLGQLSIRVIADDSTFFNEKFWYGIGSFCIPLKYNKTAFSVDSVKFSGTIAAWDEKFTNSKVDTGFVSLAGIYNIAGEENAPLHSPDSAEVIARIFFKVDSNAKTGDYHLELTKDPIQKEMYFGSTDGYHSWKPEFSRGTITVK